MLSKLKTKTKLITIQLHTTTIDDITDEVNIANYWRNHFRGILNSNVCEQILKKFIMGALDDIQHDVTYTVHHSGTMH